MPRAQRRPAPARAATPAAASSSLRLQEPPERLAALLGEQESLLERIAAKRKELGRMEERVQRAQTFTRERIGPLVDRARTLDTELHALFQELLAPDRLSKRARKEVSQVYLLLQDDGVLSPDETFDPGAAGPFDPPDDDDPFADGAPFEGGPPPPGAGGFSAERPEAAANESLRTIYRRLARALHPDTVLDEQEKERRTELMKEVTRAYQVQDLARLLDLERTWATAVAVDAPSAEDELDRRCAALERTNEELRVQLRQLGREVRGLRKSDDGRLGATFGGRHGRAAAEEAAAEIEAAIAALERTREHVLAFRDGRINLTAFLEGPAGPPDAGELGQDDELDAFFAALAAELEAPEPPPRGRRAGKRRRR